MINVVCDQGTFKQSMINVVCDQGTFKQSMINVVCDQGTFKQSMINVVCKKAERYYWETCCFVSGSVKGSHGINSKCRYY